MGVNRSRIAQWAEELGWEVTDTDPPVLTKAGRTIPAQIQQRREAVGHHLARR